MPFDFSQYLPPPPGASSGPPSSPLSQQGDTNFTNELSYLNAGANGNQGWENAATNVSAQQKQYEQLMSDPANKQYLDQINAVSQADPSVFNKTTTTTDQDGNISDPIANANYDPKLSAAKDWLTQNNMLNYTPANTGQGNTPGYYSAGALSPLGSDVWSKDGATGVSNPKNGGWLVQTPQDGTGHSLIDSSRVGNDSMWGPITNEANVKDDHANDLFWKIAPMLPGLFAGGAGLLFSGLDAAGGATAGALAGDQTVSDIGGGALNGVNATAGGALSNLPASLQKLVPNIVRTGIGQLNSSNGKGFDFTKFIPMGLQQIAKGMG